MHVGDDPEKVAQNRKQLVSQLELPAEPLWLKQVHGNRLINAAEWQNSVVADACYTDRRNTICAILTADCLPLLLCDDAGTRIAAVHLGWRGICSSLIEQTIYKMETAPSRILAWIGPHIHAGNYEVGEDVFAAASGMDTLAVDAFSPVVGERWLFSLSRLVTSILNKHGVTQVYEANACVFQEADCFYSYRREKTTGRIASLIWMES